MKGEILSLCTAQAIENVNIAIRYMKNYIEVEPLNATTEAVKREFEEVINILEGIWREDKYE